MNKLLMKANITEAYLNIMSKLLHNERYEAAKEMAPDLMLSFEELKAELPEEEPVANVAKSKEKK